jgi:hypothetical protein
VRFLENPVDTEDFLLTIAEILTEGLSADPGEPMEEHEFYRGYRQRLESKLHHKTAQIARTERLLATLPAVQKPAFEALLAEARSHQAEIQSELDTLYRLLEQVKDKV